MLVTGISQSPAARLGRPAHVIVCGNEKGGTGKSTLAMHLVIALLRGGFGVASVDLDTRQSTLTRFLDNRRRRMEATGVALSLPDHFHVPPARRATVSETEGAEYRSLMDGFSAIGEHHDFVVIDTPGHDTFLNRLAHRIADTLVTPLHQSFVDLDVLARIDPTTFAVLEGSHYALAVRDARRERRLADGRLVDWIVVCNRVAQAPSGDSHPLEACLRELGMQLGFRLSEGVSDRMAFHEAFLHGLTALDDPRLNDPAARPSLSQLAARQEIRQLLCALRLPLDEAGQRRAEDRRRNLLVPGGAAG